MTTQVTSSHHLLALTVLKTVSPDRLQKAITALVDNSMTILLTRQTEAEIRALVQNSEGKEYGVTITDGAITCSCRDALYRGVVCKHAVALALYTIRTPQAEAITEAEEERPVNLKLAKVRPGWTFSA
jgi:uncharacterized Zn finger protein